MKKRIFAFVCCLLTVMYVVTGCSLFVENEERKLNQTVASVGDVVITLDDLIRSYSNNAETLVSSYGYTAEEAVEYCLNSLLTRGVVEQVGREMEKDGKISIGDTDKNDTMYDLVSYYNSLMNAYATKAMNSLKLDVSDSSSNSDSSSSNDYTAENKFSKSYDLAIQVINGENGAKSYKLVVEDLSKKTNNEYMPSYVNVYNAYVRGDDITQSLFDILDPTYVAEYGDELKTQIYIEIENAYKNAYTQYKDLNYKQILVKELGKILKGYIQQDYIDKVSDYYKNIVYANPSADTVLTSYLNKYNASKALYENNTKAYISKMLEDASSVYYHPTNDCFYISHVLLKLSDEQTEYLKEQKQKLTSEEYELCENVELNKIRVNKYDEQGNVILENVSPNEVLDEIRNALVNATTSREMVEIFNSFVYSYNMDSGIKNSAQDYVIARAIKEDTESRSKMVQTFTDASRTMYEAYLYTQAGNDIATLKGTGITEEEIKELRDGAYIGYKDNYDDYIDDLTFAGKTIALGGQVGGIGTMTGLVKSTYGYHIIMFTGITSDADLENPIIDATRVKDADSTLFTSAEWASFVENKSLLDLAKVKLLNMVKQADPETTLTLADIDNVFTSKEIQLIALDGFTITLHSDKTYFNTVFESYASSLSANYSSGLYTDYMNKYKDTDKRFFKNTSVYEYLYK